MLHENVIQTGGVREYLSLRADQIISSNPPDWELIWAPYDEQTYKLVLSEIKPEDFVLEIGAGDLRLSRKIAEKADLVAAIEINADVLGLALKNSLPKNMQVYLADALLIAFPPGITTAVLLMRHCTHYRHYVAKLREIGCVRLITNARWRMGVEVIDLTKPRRRYHEIEIGWYACECGVTGFKPGPVESINFLTDQIIFEVMDCPNCS